jgi:hypothetical protein
MAPLLDRIGRRYGKLLVMKRASNDKYGVRWRCRCDCGGVVTVSGGNLSNGHTQSCGCLWQESMSRLRKSTPPGTRFGLLIVEGESGRDRWGAYRYRCRCDCGKITEVRASYLHQGRIISCGDKLLHFGGNKSHNWKGHGDIAGQHWSSIKHHARARGLSFNVTIKDAWLLFLAQGRRCKFTGRPLTLQKRGRTASLDRINSGRGYSRGNIQWVHKDCQRMKMDLSDLDFINLCREVTEYQKAVG